MSSKHVVLVLGIIVALLHLSSLPAFAEVLDFDVMAQQQNFSVIAQDDFLPPSLEEFERPRAVILQDNNFALVSVRCQRRDCFPFSALLKGTPGDFQIVKSVDLPRMHKPEIFEIKPPIVTDLNGDGAKELLARYVLNLAPRPGSGSLYHEYLAILSLSDLSQLAFFEIEKCGQGAVDKCCSSKIEQTDFDGDGFNDLKITTSCSVKRCLGPRVEPSCHPPLTESPQFLYSNSDSKQYSETKNSQPHPPKVHSSEVLDGSMT